jgi:transposase
MVHKGPVTTPVFKDFLTRLMIGATRPVFVIVDGHPIHMSRLVQEFVDGPDGQLKLFYLPPYSPHLNPDEQVGTHVKRRFSKQSVQAKDEMKKLALGALRRI